MEPQIRQVLGSVYQADCPGCGRAVGYLTSLAAKPGDTLPARCPRPSCRSHVTLEYVARTRATCMNTGQLADIGWGVEFVGVLSIDSRPVGSECLSRGGPRGRIAEGLPCKLLAGHAGPHESVSGWKWGG